MNNMTSSAVYLIVLDSVGIGAAPDAAEYGDSGANTLANTAAAAGGLNTPVMQRWGLGNIPALLPVGLDIKGVAPTTKPTACYGAMQELSCGKDTTTGHWEMAGILLEQCFSIFPPGPPAFPAELLNAFSAATGRACLGNCAASGTKIIQQLGVEHLQSGKWIVYTSADSVFQIAAHEEIIPLHELYRACDIARELCNPLHVGRVIARPFTGGPAAFTRTGNRRDFSYPLPEPTVLDHLKNAGINVTTVGKLDDIFNHRGFHQSIHVETSAEAEQAVLELAAGGPAGLVFANLIDFDMLYGHRRNPHGYATALAETDKFLGKLEQLLRPGDLIIITADHGNDPTFPGSDHTREFVPLLVRGAEPPRSVGIRHGFYDIAKSLCAHFAVQADVKGESFL